MKRLLAHIIAIMIVATSFAGLDARGGGGHGGGGRGGGRGGGFRSGGRSGGFRGSGSRMSGRSGGARMASRSGGARMSGRGSRTRASGAHKAGAHGKGGGKHGKGGHGHHGHHDHHRHGSGGWGGYGYGGWAPGYYWNGWDWVAPLAIGAMAGTAIGVAAAGNSDDTVVVQQPVQEQPTVVAEPENETEALEQQVESLKRTVRTLIEQNRKFAATTKKPAGVQGDKPIPLSGEPGRSLAPGVAA